MMCFTRKLVGCVYVYVINLVQFSNHTFFNFFECWTLDIVLWKTRVFNNLLVPFVQYLIFLIPKPHPPPAMILIKTLNRVKQKVSKKGR
ncbi:hypothetical protein HanRHA438_Chr14g0636821 [Helianthus annuus]|nr:hypothetical protein HanRHA438_Chr14g0636821 [Helianthus annuus]